jgi:hypothetical protein
MTKDKKGEKNPKKKQKKAKKSMQTKIILQEKMDESEGGDEYESGMFLDKESIQIIYNALSAYKPSEREEHLHGVLLEEFEEILVVDYKEPHSDAN